MYVVALLVITIVLGRTVDEHLYWGFPVVAGLLIGFFIVVNRTARDSEQRARLLPYAKWLIYCGVAVNVALMIWKHFAGKSY